MKKRISLFFYSLFTVLGVTYFSVMEKISETIFAVGYPLQFITVSVDKNCIRLRDVFSLNMFHLLIDIALFYGIYFLIFKAAFYSLKQILDENEFQNVMLFLDKYFNKAILGVILCLLCPYLVIFLFIYFWILRSKTNDD